MIDPDSLFANPAWPRFVDRCFCVDFAARSNRRFFAGQLFRDLPGLYAHAVTRPALLGKVDLIRFTIRQCRGYVFEDEAPLADYEGGERWVRFTDPTDAVLFKVSFA